LQSRTLRELPTKLTVAARQRGLFDQREAVHESVDEEKAVVKSAAGHSVALGDRGLAVYKNREIITWATLPHDQLGSIFDEEDINSRLAALLTLHASTGLIADGIVALAVSIEPIMMLMVGSASDINRRSEGQYRFHMTSNSSLRIDAVDAVDAKSLISAPNDVADELTSRLALKVKSLER
jgi:hypothetical protein